MLASERRSKPCDLLFWENPGDMMIHWSFDLSRGISLFNVEIVCELFVRLDSLLHEANCKFVFLNKIWTNLVLNFLLLSTYVLELWNEHLAGFVHHIFESFRSFGQFMVTDRFCLGLGGHWNGWGLKSSWNFSSGNIWHPLRCCPFWISRLDSNLIYCIDDVELGYWKLLSKICELRQICCFTGNFFKILDLLETRN